MKRLAQVCAIVCVALAAAAQTPQQTVTTVKTKNLYVTTQPDGCAQFASGKMTSTAVPCPAVGPQGPAGPTGAVAGFLTVDGTSYTTINAAVTAACAASPHKGVIIPPNYAGSDDFTNSCSTQVKDWRINYPQAQREVRASDFGSYAAGDCTANVQAAINYLNSFTDLTSGYHGGAVRIDGYCNNLNFPALTIPNSTSNPGWLVFKISDKVRNTGATWNVPPHVAIIGDVEGYGGGYSGGQFAAKAMAFIYCAAGSSHPCISLAANTAMINIAASSVRLNNAANVILQNVWLGTDSAGADDYPLEALNTQWFWADHIYLMPQAGQWALHLLSACPNTGGQWPGNFSIKNFIMGGQGVKVEQTGCASPAPLGGFHFQDGILEGGPFMQVDGGNSTVVRNVLIENTSLADCTTNCTLLKTINGDETTIGEVTIINPDTGGNWIVDGGSPCVHGLHVMSGPRTLYSSGWTPGTSVCDLMYEHSGVYDGAWVGSGMRMGPFLAPFATTSLPQDLTTWNLQTTVTSGILAPDGTNTAYRVAAGGVGQVYYDMGMSGLAVGDYLIAGVWAQSDGTHANYGGTGFSGPSLEFPSNPGNTLSAGDPSRSGSDIWGDTSGRWYEVTHVAKLTAVSASSATLRVHIPGSGNAYWRPWLLTIPASSGMSMAEVYRYARLVLQNGVPNMPAGGGILAMYDHQKLYHGNDFFWSHAAGTETANGNFSVTGNVAASGTVSASKSATIGSTSTIAYHDAKVGQSSLKTVTLTPAISNGDTLILATYSQSSTSPTLTDQGGAALPVTRVEHFTAGCSGWVDFWQSAPGAATAATTSITATSLSNGLSFIVGTYSGVAAINPVRTWNSVGSGDLSVSITTQFASDFAVGIAANDGSCATSGTTTATSGTLRAWASETGTGARGIALVDNTVSTPGTVTDTLHYTSPHNAVMGVIELQSATGMVNAFAGFQIGNTPIGAQCGTTTTCANTPAQMTHEFYGRVTLAAGTATVTGFSPAFTSTATFGCTASDQTTGTNAAAAVPASASSVTVTGTGTDVIFYDCKGT